MYQGQQHKMIVEAIEILRKFTEIDFYIISAGFGLLNQDNLIPCYDSTFSDKTKNQILERSKKLDIMNDFKKLPINQYDFLYLALGQKYLHSIFDWEKYIKSLTIAFTPSNNDNVLSIGANNEIVHALKEIGYKIHGTIGLKGDLLKMIAQKIAQSQKPYQKIVETTTNKKNLKEFIKNQIYNFW